VIWLDWLLVFLVCAGIPAALYAGRVLERTETRARGEHAIRVFRELNAHDPWIFLTATERLIRKATGLDDLEPPNDRNDA
jgi:hypothetical protein